MDHYNPLVPISFFEEGLPVKRTKKKGNEIAALPPGVLAIDIDIERITAYSSTKKVVQDGGAKLPVEEMLAHDVVLVETASPHIYGNSSDKGNQYNRLRWMIYNIARSVECYNIKPTALFSPSSVWTMKYPEKTRESMAGVYGEYNHDVRACICMIYFYSISSGLWVPWDKYMKTIINGKD
jgi:hypothetical protein